MVNRKRELYDLVRELHGRGFTSTVLIAEALNLSHTRIRDVLIDLGLIPRRPLTLDDVVRRCPDDLIARIDAFNGLQSATCSQANS
jgi:hypothetical protein